MRHKFKGTFELTSQTVTPYCKENSVGVLRHIVSIIHKIKLETKCFPELLPLNTQLQFHVIATSKVDQEWTQLAVPSELQHIQN
jgi:hypothetical protein